MSVRPLRPEPLTRAAFASFGQVIEAEGAETRVVNGGHALRRHALAAVEPGPDGRVILSIFEATPRPLPLVIHMLERHPLASQAFMPLSDRDWLVVVGEGDAAPDPATLRCFRATGRQGVNYRPGCWHFPVLVLGERQDFLVADRDGPGANLDEAFFEAVTIAL
ncbi:ureidoglycolate lyase [Methylopila jiangsuensis]|uniref:Ureidoglycolate lyase n=1 Tax=Methylopila jiangsuensis TaxID=586230 RepID=A0A9W6N4Y5_9HYPH|nr:ureidoglycolate lyase [Methylopila jiangsuensis]MDR6284930.1 ureidoglycolate lyase [Methylopila jiangsuensis]GLK77682.1 ureidoglycolate lyase [Methylopila jiangsuensis]